MDHEPSQKIVTEGLFGSDQPALMRIFNEIFTEFGCQRAQRKTFQSVQNRLAIRPAMLHQAIAAAEYCIRKTIADRAELFVGNFFARQRRESYHDSITVAF